ncbi:hypothetical protein BDR03DRAFT_945436 [Suillus americanus]|nr:hypothetical protein BDR03DRAFT_945436 [Suillus americanus]
MICFVYCAIYDSGTPDARLIGIEYIVSGQVTVATMCSLLIAVQIFKSLPEEEKEYWHSHKHEVYHQANITPFI